jgi:hypothetical protein
MKDDITTRSPLGIGCIRSTFWWFTDSSNWKNNSQLNSVRTNSGGYRAVFWYTPYVGGECLYSFWCTFLLKSDQPSAAKTTLGQFWSDWRP